MDQTKNQNNKDNNMNNNNVNNQNSSNKDVNNSDEIPIKYRLFNFYYNVLRKKDLSLFLTVLLILLETFQLISYGLSEPHLNTWKIKSKSTLSLVSSIVTAPRLTTLMKYLSFKYYIIIYGILLAYIFFHCLLMAMIIKLNKPNSKIYAMGVTFTRYFSSPLTIFLMIPISEIILLPLRCENGKISIIKNAEECYEGLYALYATLSIIFVILFYLLLFVNSLFYFDPFNTKVSTTKVDTTADTFLNICKMVLVLKFIFIKNEYISIVILVVLSLFNLKTSMENPTYNNYILECFISIRNASFFWTFLVLLIAKLCESSKINGIIYLLLFGYPMIIVLSILYYKKESEKFMISSANFNDVNEYLIKLKYLIKLIDNYLNQGKQSKGQIGAVKRNEILLKGFIQSHEEGCLNEECPLKKFIENSNNYAAQKTCLLHYMNNMFVEGIKKFPNSRVMLLIYVQFNYEKKYNLNAAKTYLTKLENQKNTLTENYIIFSIKQSILNTNNKVQSGINDTEELMKFEDTAEQKYKRLKLLIETSTKLYGEFWGILATNLTNNLNLNKLYTNGNKLNKYLLEINNIWENDLKSKKIDLENQSIAQLYSYFLREILKNKKRAEEISKKLNEEQHFENRKNENDKFDLDNLDLVLENQEAILYCRANEKGECDIVQCSNSVIHLLGYTKQELIGKNIEVMMPGIFCQDHSKMLQQRIKNFRQSGNNNSMASVKENFRAAASSTEQKTVFILPRSKIGYLIPINSKFMVYNDDDFSNTYIIKCKFEPKDTKSVYAFYILTKDDFSVDSISSSSMNLGLTMDLLKKYVINMNILVRSESNMEDINFNEKLPEYEEEMRKVTWVFPDKIYPKNDTQRNDLENIDNLNELIKQSDTKKFMLVVNKMKYADEQTIGYCFRFTEVDKRKNLVEPGDFKTNSHQHIMFDMLRLCYIRTLLVDVKSANAVEYHPYKNNKLIDTNINNADKDGVNKRGSVDKVKKKKKDDANAGNANTVNNKGDANLKETKNGNASEEGSEDDEEEKVENLLTKEKIIELQTRSHNEIKEFIFTLPFYGKEVMLEKHRPNKEKYTVGKTLEPEIKISIAQFIKRIDERIKLALTKKNDKYQSSQNEETSTLENQNADQTIDASLSNEFSSDSSAALSKIFNDKSILYIQFFSLITFALIIGIITAEFIISLKTMNDSSDRVGYMDKAFSMLNSLIYTKFFLTESILAQDPNYKNTDGSSNEDYIKVMMEEMSECRKTFSNMFSYYSNATVTFSKAYTNYIENTQVNIKTLSNGIPNVEVQPFSIAMGRIPTSIFYVSTMTDNFDAINLEDRNTYELMQNLLNDYLLVWRNVTFLLVQDVKDRTISNGSLIFIFVFSFILSTAVLIGLWQLITKFIADRQKPIDLFLTIKKKKFEELKAVSENFVNKLLNKFFGNEENEEESMIDYSTNIKADDINIIKFKTKNEYKQSLRTSKEYLFNYIKTSIFFLVIQIYMIFKFCYNKSALSNMNQFSDVFNVTHYSQSDIILSLDVLKSYFYDSTIDIYNSSDTYNIFMKNFLDISDTFEKVLISTYNTSCFLKDSYMNQLYDLFNSDISKYALINSSSTGGGSSSNSISTNANGTSVLFLGTMKNGLKAIMSRYFELIRFICISFLRDRGDTKSYLYDEEFQEINSISKNVIRPLYDVITELIKKKFKDYVSQTRLINASTYIVLLVAIILLYCLVWKSYEEHLKELLKTAVDLINLIPEEIKYQIVLKLNEEDVKNE